ncbi:MAG: GNAT family N-acetyltransferase [Ottowia sp.]|nr:GNAT family N-acetyltransferase [Ottowia sp.]
MKAFYLSLPNIDDRNKFVHFVDENDGQIISVVSIIRVINIPRPGQINNCWGYLTNVYILPAFRRRGIGKRLLATARAWATEQKLDLLLVWPTIHFMSRLVFGAR